MHIETWYQESGPKFELDENECLSCLIFKYQFKFILDWGLGNPFLRQSIKKEEAKFVELPLDQLEERYDRQWLQDRVVSCSLTAVFCWKSVIEILPKHVSSCFEDLTAGVIFE